MSNQKTKKIIPNIISVPHGEGWPCDAWLALASPSVLLPLALPELFVPVALLAPASCPLGAGCANTDSTKSAPKFMGVAGTAAIVIAATVETSQLMTFLPLAGNLPPGESQVTEITLIITLGHQS